jgi:hypothetical protein
VDNPCEKLSFQSVVNSPQPAVIMTLKVGFVLDVRLQTTPHVAVVVSYKGNLAGALTGTKVAALINCLQNSYKFKADVMSITGGNCQVEVRPA